MGRDKTLMREKLGQKRYSSRESKSACHKYKQKKREGRTVSLVCEIAVS